jgi:uncharacterized repeat protein (TIGR03803 family)
MRIQANGIMPFFVAAIAGVAATGQALALPKTSTVYAFTDGADGGFPEGGVIADKTGALYGTTTSGGADHSGVIYKLTPPAAGSKTWTQSTLYTFTGGNDGAIPYGSLLMDSTGALYGATPSGGANGDGVVYKLTPPAAGKSAWTQTVLWTFTGGADGGEPMTALIADASGNLYGTASIGGAGNVGAVFELSPPAAGKTAWTETVLYSFTGNNDGGEPWGNMLMDASGNLYGTTVGYGADNYGTVYYISPPAKAGGTWGFTLLHTFSGGSDGSTPRDGLIGDSNGNLYGTSAGFDNSYGTVFKLSPPAKGATAWKEDVLHSFHGAGFTGNGPWQTVTMDAAGALYGATMADGHSASGEVFKVTPPATGNHWTTTILHVFGSGMRSQFPYCKPYLNSAGTLFGTTYGQAGQNGFVPGTVFQITK